MSDTREKLREVIARAILAPDESYSGENPFDTDWYERELALHRADCVLRAIDVNRDLVLAVMEGRPDPEDGGESSVFLAAPPMSSTMRQAVEEAKQRPPARHFEPSTLFEDGERT